MKYLIGLVFFFFSCSIFSQEENNTLIIFYDSELKYNAVKHEESTVYYFRFNNNRKLSLISNKYEDFDFKERNQPMLNFEVDKSFLKKNKSIIYRYDDIIKMGVNKAYSILSNSKNILLIDKKENKKNKIRIKKVIFGYNLSE